MGRGAEKICRQIRHLPDRVVLVSSCQKRAFLPAADIPLMVQTWSHLQPYSLYDCSSEEHKAKKTPLSPASTPTGDVTVEGVARWSKEEESQLPFAVDNVSAFWRKLQMFDGFDSNSSSKFEASVQEFTSKPPPSPPAVAAEWPLPHLPVLEQQ